MRIHQFPLASRIVVYAIMFGLANLLGFALRPDEQALATMWPPHGIGLAVLLLEPRKLWATHLSWMFAVDASLSHLQAEEGIAFGWSAFFAGINTFEVLLAILLMLRFRIVPLNCKRVWDYSGFAAIVCLVTPCVSGLTAGIGVYLLLDINLLASWGVWWMGSALGFLVWTPVVLSFLNFRAPAPGGPEKRPAEGLLLAGCFGVAALATCSQISPYTADYMHGGHLAVPFAIWAATRFSWKELSWVLLASCLILCFELRGDTAPFQAATPEGESLSVQAFLLILCIPSMLLVASLHGLRATGARLRKEILNRKTLEIRRRKLESSLQRSQRMETIARLSSGMAHDMGNLIQVVAGNVDLLEMDEQAENESLESIRAALAQAAEVTRSLLEIGQVHARLPESLVVAELIDSTVVLMQKLLPRSFEIRLAGQIDPDLRVRGVQPQLKQALINLILNARDACDDRGEVILSAVADDSIESRDLIHITVCDNGPGIPEDQLERVFEDFHTTKKPGKGTGLGLALVASVIDAHGGHVSARNNPTGGASFQIQLPKAATAGSLQDDVGETRLHEQLALVVDDDPQVRSALRRQVEDLGFETLGVESGSALLNLLSSHRDAVGLILLDQSMPGMAGDEVAARLRAKGWETPILLMCSKIDELRGSADELRLDLLRKPIDQGELRAIVQRSFETQAT